MIAGLCVSILIGIVGARWMVRHRGVLGMVKQVDDLYLSVATWQAAHSDRMSALAEHMSDIEVSVSRAEDSARSAAADMTDITGALHRLERIEHRAEITLLVAQGRISGEHPVVDVPVPTLTVAGPPAPSSAVTPTPASAAAVATDESLGDLVAGRLESLALDTVAGGDELRRELEAMADDDVVDHLALALESIARPGPT